MKLKEDCRLHQVAGENIILRPGRTEVDMTRVIALNGTALWLWEQLWGREFTPVEAVDLLTVHYDVDAVVAGSDVEAWLAALEQQNLLEV